MAGWSRFAEELSDARYPALLAYATLLAGDRAAAEDLVHDALLRTFGRPRPIDTLQQAEGYVRRAILTTFLDGARRRAAQTRAYTRVVERTDVPTRESAVDDRDEVIAALAELAPQVRACIVLRFYDDLTVADVAERTGVALGTAKRYLHEGMTALRLEIDDPTFQRETTTSTIEVAGGSRRQSRRIT